MKTLVINTYGGSLLLGAKALGLEIIGSYEDTGFGMPIQQANFPNLDFRPQRKDWPAQDLSETFVIAHPPCSAFSVQTQNPEKRGVNSAAFACTKSVLEYACSQRAVGIAVESVVGALAGAWPIHQYYADTYGYNIYRILENGCMWGAQWRDRFWVLYLRKGSAPDILPIRVQPRWRTIRDVVAGFDGGPAPAGMDVALAKLKTRFTEEAGCTEEELAEIFESNPKEELCSIDDRLWRLKFPTEDRWEVCKKYVTKYASSAMILLYPEGLCPVLLGGSWWYLDGRNLSETAYKRLMGFPSTYVFPEEGRYRQDMRTYLSKGVMPPIAAWVLEQALTHLGWKAPEAWTSNAPWVEQPRDNAARSAEYLLEIGPNQVADFRIRKKTWGQEHPPLRHEDPRPRGPVAKPYVPTEGEVPPESKAPRAPRQPRPPRQLRRPRSPWNAPELEESLKETLFVRPNTADAYALYESHGYHRMGVREGDVLLDLGAHIGCVASRAALIGATKVVSVEPEPENFALLQQNTRSYAAVQAIQAAVYGGEGETVGLHRVKRRDDGGHSTGTHSCTFKTNGDTLQVPRVDFRVLLDTVRPTVIKCDIEGGEFSLDWTNLPACVRAIGIELHTRRDLNREKAKELVGTLEAQGFKPVHHLNLESNFSAIIAFLSREERKEEPHEDRGGVVPS